MPGFDAAGRGWIPVIFLILAALSAISVGCSTGFRLPGNSQNYNVVLISLDTTRSDYVDTGEGARAFTPELKRFAQQAAAFERAYTTIPQTLPAHLSILTSYYPHECEVLSNQYAYDGRYKMLQEILKEKGYSTAGVISLGTISDSTGIAAGFDEYREALDTETVFFASAQQVTREGLKLLKKLKRQKFFLFLHYSDPHSPYAPPSLQGKLIIDVDGNPVTQFNAYQGAVLRTNILLSPGTHRIRFKVDKNPQDFEGFVIRRLKFSKNCSASFRNLEFSKTHYGGSHVLRGAEGEIEVKCSGEGFIKMFQVIPLQGWKASVNYYRQEVEYMDRYIGKFLAALEREQLLDKTIVVILGDHGEGLGERERFFGHIRYLNRQYIEVPLIMHFPGLKARRIAVPVSHINIAPTVLDFLGISHPGFSSQKSLLALIKTGRGKPKPVYSFAFKPSATEDKLSVISWPYQCIYNKDNSETTTREFYNFSLSQSFRKWDEFSPDVINKNSSREYYLLQQSALAVRNVFTIRQYARLNENKKEMEKLKTLGYIQ